MVEDALCWSVAIQVTAGIAVAGLAQLAGSAFVGILGLWGLGHLLYLVVSLAGLLVGTYLVVHGVADLLEGTVGRPA